MTAPLLLHVFPSFAIGGAQARFVTLANAFGDRFRHAVVAMDGDLGCATRLQPDLAVSYPHVAVRKGDTTGNLRRFRRLLRDLRPDGLVTSNWGAIEWVLANLPGLVAHLHTEDGFGPDERDRQLPRRVWVRRLLLRRSQVMVPSQVLRRIATDVWRLPPDRIRYIPNGIDLNRFRPALSCADGSRSGGPPVIGTVAGLRAEKNVARLLRAFARVRATMAARLIIVGDGPERARLETLAAELGVAADTHFHGHAEEPSAVYGAFDVFALSSDTEQMPISILEAMACGLPIASTDVGDVSAMIAAEGRRFLAPRDDAALAERLSALIGDAGLRRDLGHANRARAEAVYGLETMVAAHAALLAEVLGARRTGETSVSSTA